MPSPVVKRAARASTKAPRRSVVRNGPSSTTTSLAPVSSTCSSTVSPRPAVTGRSKLPLAAASTVTVEPSREVFSANTAASPGTAPAWPTMRATPFASGSTRWMRERATPLPSGRRGGEVDHHGSQASPAGRARRRRRVARRRSPAASSRRGGVTRSPCRAKARTTSGFPTSNGGCHPERGDVDRFAEAHGRLDAGMTSVAPSAGWWRPPRRDAPQLQSRSNAGPRRPPSPKRRRLTAGGSVTATAASARAARSATSSDSAPNQRRCRAQRARHRRAAGGEDAAAEEADRRQQPHQRVAPRGARPATAGRWVDGTVAQPLAPAPAPPPRDRGRCRHLTSSRTAPARRPPRGAVSK